MGDVPASISIHPRAAASLRLRLLLPPNLATVAPRDAIPIKLELAPSGEKPISPEKLPAGRGFQMREAEATALARIEEWCGGRLATFLQLDRAKLGELLNILQGEASCFWVNRPMEPISWKGEELVGVSSHLPPDEKPPAPPLTPSPLPARPAPKAVTKPAAPAAAPMVIDGSTQYVAITLPSREHPLYHEALAMVKQNDFLLEPSNRKWWLRDRHKTLSFLAEHLSDLRQHFSAQFSPNFERNLAGVEEAEVTMNTDETADGFSLELAVRARGFEAREVQDSLQTSRPYLERDGRVVLLPRRKLEELEEVRRHLSGRSRTQAQPSSHHRLSAADLAVAGDLLQHLLPNFEAPAAWREKSEALGNISRLQPAPLPPEVDDCLRLYQRIGVSWMYHLFQHKLAGVLADEMGLGKTLQALGLVEAARARSGNGGSTGPALVVCPASLVENWQREARRFVPDLRVFLHYRDRRLNAPAEAADADLVITSYATLIRDQELFRQIDWNCIIADEAQHIKNRRTQNARALYSLKGRGRFVLTGTPVENSLSDLVSLFAFLMPGYLDEFPSDARGEERVWHEERLRKKAAPYILRRTKAWVAPELPEKIEQTLFCEMEEAQRALYETVLGQAREELETLAGSGQREGAIRNAMFTRLLRLRQICCDPRLVEKEASAADSGKLNAFREILAEAIDDGHRLLVFSQFVSVLQLLKTELEEQGLRYTYLDGQTRNRLQVCDTFNEDPGIPVFLISLKAGGTGLNLTGADTVVHFDPWWNPAAEAQATDRAHRIGQKKVVTSIKLIASGSIEEKVLALQQAKRHLLENLFEASAAANAPIGIADLRELLSETR
jgi:SNF2 family DNA or RNA helicase